MGAGARISLIWGRREGVGKGHKVKNELSNVSVVCHDGAENKDRLYAQHGQSAMQHPGPKYPPGLRVSSEPAGGD